MTIDMIARKATYLRLRGARLSTGIAIDALEKGWVNGQHERVLNEISLALRDLKDAKALLNRGVRRATKKARL